MGEEMRIELNNLHAYNAYICIYLDIPMCTFLEETARVDLNRVPGSPLPEI
jgi:hypothetical protein